MIVFSTHNYYIFSRKEIWFYNGEQFNPGIYNVYAAAEQPSQLKAQFLEKYKTTVIDLTRPEEELFKAIHPTYRYDIRSSEKKKLDYFPILKPTQDDCNNLMISFREVARTKGILFLSKHWLSALQKSENIFITKIVSGSTDIVTHVYLFDKKHIHLTNSFHNINFSDDRVRSEANKLLHWKDILLFKNLQFHFYDFGGINPEKLPGISQFKINFGGEIKEKYRFIQTSNLVYQLINLFKRIKN